MPCSALGDCFLSLLLDGFQFLGCERDLAGDLFFQPESVSELGQQVGDDFALGFGELGVDGGLGHAVLLSRISLQEGQQFRSRESGRPEEP